VPRLRLVLCAALAGATLAGCDLSVAQDADVAPTEDGARAGLIRLYGGPEHEGTCFADALLSAVTLEQLVAAEIIEDDGEVAAALPQLTPDVAAAWVDAATTCTPPTPCLTRRMSTARLRDGRIAVLTGDLDGPEARAAIAAEEACSAG